MSISVYLISALLATTQQTWARLAEEALQPHTEDPCQNIDLHCYLQPPESCPPADNACRCKLDKCKRAVICCDVTQFLLTEGLACANINLNRDDITSIHIRNATIETLNLNDLKSWRTLTSMSITDGKIGNVIGEFGRYTKISCLNLSSNAIANFENRSLVNLYNLTTLDLSHNNLSDVPRFKKDGVVTLDISNNTPIFCTNLLDAMNARPDMQFKNGDKTSCIVTKNFQWFNSTELVPLSQVERIHQLRKDCTKNCTCKPHRWDIVPGKPPTFAVMVDCSSQNFTEMPSPLPQKTIALNISNNNISTLDPISEDDSYQSLRELYADNNEITSILALEGTKFISNFVGLSLKNNRIKYIPTYVLSNIFDRNYNSRNVYLGHNKLHCDCNTAKVFKVWLLTKQKHIIDYDEIECENMNLKVINLDPLKLCQSQHDWTDYIYYVITLEVFLLVGLVAKVSYDYWVFKTAGYLPWPASKMPKLPCDWLCE